MINQFLDIKDRKKLAVFKELAFLPEGNYLREVKKKLKLKDETVRRYIRELKQDLNDIFSNDVRIYKGSTGRLYIQKSYKLSLDYIVVILTNYYMQHTLLYQLLSTLIVRNYNSVSEIAYELNFSEAAIYRELTHINNLLLPFKAKINLSENGNIEGNEIGIRYFLYLTSWHLLDILSGEFENIKICDETIDFEDIKESLTIKQKLSPLQEYKTKQLLSITLNRSNNFQEKIKVDPHFLRDIYLFEEERLVFKNYNASISLTNLLDESKLFSFMIRGLLIYIDSPEEKKKIVNRYRRSDLKVSEEINKFLAQFTKICDVQITAPVYTEIYYRFLFIFIYYKYFRFDIDPYISVSVKEAFQTLKDKKGYKKVSMKLEKLTSVFPIDPPLTRNETQNLLSTFYNIYELCRHFEPVYIFVNHLSNFSYTTYIKHYLSSIYSEKILQFTHDINQANIVISSSLEGVRGDYDFFYLGDIYDQKNWENLVSFISKYIYKYRLN